MNQQNLADFIWSVADVLRGDFKQSIYGRIILPFTPRDVVRESEINQKGKARKLWDIEEGKGI